MSAPAYLIVEMHVTDLEQYRHYMAEAPAVVKAAGGEYLVRGGRHEPLEGQWQPGRLAMIRSGGITTFTFESKTAFPETGGIVLALHDQIQTFEVPFKIDNISLLGMPMK